MTDQNPSRPVLDDWVYAERHLRASFDAELLEKHGMAQLARALNSHRLIAVVGSGVSNGYGQPSWQDLLLAMAEMIEETFFGTEGDAFPHLRDYVLAKRAKNSDVAAQARLHITDVAPIIDTFLSLNLVRGAKAYPADRMPIAFEVCENLFAALTIRREERAGRLISHRLATRAAHKALRDRLKWQLKDDRGRMELLLRRLASRPAFKGRSTGAASGARTVHGLLHIISYATGHGEAPSRADDRLAGVISHLLYRSSPRKAHSRRNLTGKGTLKLREEKLDLNLALAADNVVDGAALLIPILEEAFDRTQKPSAEGSPKAVRDRIGRSIANWLRQTRSNGPDNRYLIEAAFELLSPSEVQRVLWGLLQAAEDWIEHGRPEVSQRATRALTPRHRDPFAVILDDLKIKRILTTNYDGEIDRLLDSRGYVPLKPVFEESQGAVPRADVLETSPSRSVLVDDASNRAEILAYEPGAAAYLYDYGADTRDQRTQVLHIHGRVNSPDSWLVLSERDYRERYARDDDPRARADDAMRLIFTANPLLFIGLGMREPDILRPLRAFSEDVARLCDRPAIALLPREGDTTTQEQVEALSRYGVYNLYYGAASAKVANDQLPDDPLYMSRLLGFQGGAWNYLADKSKAYARPDDDDFLKIRVTAVEGSRPGAYAVRPMRGQIKLIDNLLAGTPGLTTLAAHQRSAAALGVLNEGLGGAARTTFMTAWLRRSVGDWTAWHENWSAAPKRREPEGHIKVVEGERIEASRHRTLLRNLEMEQEVDEGKRARKDSDPGSRAPETDRFFAGAPSPAFQVLRASLRGQVAKPSQGRRLLYLLSQRGTGRGHVFSAMRSPRRFAHLCDWLDLTDPKSFPVVKKGLPSDKATLAHARNIHNAFFNMGVSHEVISTFDRLISFLEEFCVRLLSTRPTDAQEFRTGCVRLKGDRINRLTHVMKRLAEIGPAPDAATAPPGGVERAVVVINHLSVLFEKGGRPKNAQVRRLYEALVGAAFDKAPVDFIFMMNEQQLPDSLREATCNNLDRRRAGDERPLRAKLIMPPGLPTDRARELTTRIRNALGIDAKLIGDGRSKDQGEDPRTYIHFMPRMRPVTLAARFFPRVAAALAYLGTEEAKKRTVVTFGPLGARHAGTTYDVEDRPDLRFGDAATVRDFQTRIRLEFESHLTRARAPGERGSREALDTEIVLGVAFAGDAIEEVMLRTLEAHRTCKKGRSPLTAASDAIIKGIRELAAPSSSASEHRTKKYFEKVATAVGHNRYAMTLVLAAIDDMIARRLPEEPVNLVDLKPIANFIDTLRLDTAGKAPSVRDDAAIANVLKLYRTDVVSTMGHPMKAWPFEPFISGGDYGARLYAAKQPLLYDLQDRIMVALAMIGQPVEASVLTGVAPVAQALETLMVDLGLSRDDPEWNRVGQDYLLRILDLLVHRCLIFRIAAKGPEDVKEAEVRHRFVTHKSMRRYLYRQLNAPIIDYAEVDQLTVSLYATQPSDLPRPTADGHRRVRHLIEQLSLFEKGEGERGHASIDPFLDDPRVDAEERTRIARARLRGAYGALRSIYSVGVVSRFSTYEEEGIDTPDNGYFESHRMRVRWMLRMANRLDGVWTKGQDETEAATLHTFHAEEIVWLFNECGVLSLAQGRTNDAVALLSQATRITREFIESAGRGPLHARIGVNKAIGDIQRGRLRDAERVFRDVVREGEQEHVALRLIARGYLALIQELRGDPVGASKAYGPIIEELVDIGRYRTAAIFTIQHADCLRSRGRAFASEAMELAARACSYAAEGGHEDIRQIAELGQAWAEIVLEQGAMSAQTRRRIERRLGEVEEYAKLMGMPRLTCATALARGALYLDQGDYRMSAELAQTALRIATRHDLELRKITALSQLGTAMLKQSMPEARSLLVRARELAYHADFTTVISKIEEALGDRSGAI